MPCAPYGRGDTHEYGADEQVAGNLLGPRGRAVQHVAREELVEDVESEQPEENERRPILDQVLAEVDRRILDVKVPFGVEDMFAGGSGRSGFGHRGSSKGSERRFDTPTRRRIVTAPRQRGRHLIATILS